MRPSAVKFASIFALSLAALTSGALTTNAQQSGPIRLAPLPPPETLSGATRDNAGEGPAATPDGTSLEPGGVMIRGLGALAEDAVGQVD